MAGPESRQFTELQSLPSLPLEKIKTLNEKSLYDFYSRTILRAENLAFNGRNTRIHKLLFLVGGPENDTSVSVDEFGKSIYFKKPNFPKLPEIPEATAALSNYFESKYEKSPDANLIETNLVKAMSEIADVFHNLVALTILDSSNEINYKDDCINRLTASLGLPDRRFSINDSLLLAYIKYRERLIDTREKNILHENMLVKMAMMPNAKGKPLIRTPTDEGLASAFRTINEIKNDVLKPQLIYIERKSKWNTAALHSPKL